MYLSKEESTLVVGGMSGTYLNAMARIGKLLYDIGYQFGSGIRRAFSKKSC